MVDVKVEKNMYDERPIPTTWRRPLSQIANAFVEKNFPNVKIADYLGAWRENILSINYSNIDDYPDKLGTLHPNTWKTSICQWEDSYWTVLLDLSDVNGNTTDLVLHLKVTKNSKGYKFEPELIYVP